MQKLETDILAIDTSLAGIAGDMLFVSLLGLIKDPLRILERIKSSITQHTKFSFEITTVETSYQGFKGKKLFIEGGEQRLDQAELISILDLCLNDLNIASNFKKIAKTFLQILFSAEQNVHSTVDIHLHELATLDTIIDIVGIITLLNELDIQKVQLSPVAIGQGTIMTKHGLLPVPPPATDYILQKYDLITTVGPIGEATTPTGAALLAAISKHLELSYNAVWVKSSLGFGSKEWSDRGNYVRTRLGREASEYSKISVLESHIDDATGEILGHAIDILIDKGALDVSYYPIIMKKGRPAYCIRVLSPQRLINELSTEIIKQTGTLGVRIIDVNRHIGNRRFEKVSTSIQEKPVEFTIKHGEFSSKIEFDDIVRISKELNISPIKLQSELLSIVKPNDEDKDEK